VRALAVAGLLCGLVACSNLPEIEPDVCGNAVVEDEEDCDTFAVLVTDAHETPVRGGSCRPRGNDHECRFDCRERSDGTRPACPNGWGCDAEGICREAADGFVESEPFDTDPASWLGLTDFDADGREELLSLSLTDKLKFGNFALHYFDAGGRVERHAFPQVGSRPISRDLDGDRADDLIFSNGSIGLLPGRKDRAWVPSTFSSYQVPGARLRSASVRDQRVDMGIALVAITAFGGEHGVYITRATSPYFEPIYSFDEPIESLLGGAVNGDLVEGPDSPCREVVLAFQGASSARVLDVCSAADNLYGALWRDRASERRVELPPGAWLDAPPLIADLDGDGHLDLLLGASGELFVSYGDGSELEAQAAPFELEFVRESSTFPERLRPLAAGDFTGDGIADFVLPDKLLSSRQLPSGSNVYEQSQVNLGAPWTVARIADVNANGLPDAIAASNLESGIAFFNGTREPYQIGSVIATGGPVSHLAVDDFDGDLVSDIAFTRQRPATPGSTDLVIAFGELSGAPESVVQVAQVRAQVEEIVPFHEIGIGSMLMSWNSGSGKEIQAEATLLQGSSDRLPFAPRALVSFGYDQNLSQASALALCVGTLTKQGQSDGLALGLELYDKQGEPEGRLQFWLLADMGVTDAPPRRVLPEALPVERRPVLLEGAETTISTTAIAGDFDGDGRDESVWVMPEGDGCVLAQYVVDAAGPTIAETHALHFAEPCPAPRVEKADLDRDGALDLLLSIGDESVAPLQLQLLWNDGAGRFSVDDRTLVAPAGSVRGFHAYPGRSTEDPARLAVVTDLALYRVTTPAGAKRRYETINELLPLLDGRSVVVTDHNGDNLPDMVASDQRGIFLLEAQLK
jgi:hypothetical protein